MFNRGPNTPGFWCGGVRAPVWHVFKALYVGFVIGHPDMSKFLWVIRCLEVRVPASASLMEARPSAETSQQIKEDQ